MTRLAAASFVSVLALAACTEPAAGPTLDQVDHAADAELTLVDRTAALAGAVDYMDAATGEQLDLANQNEAFYLQVTEPDAGEPDPNAPPASSYGNVIAASMMVATASGITAAVVGPPSLAIGVATDGDVTQIEDNLWQATNSIVIDEVTYALELNVAYVVVGYLAEMRVTTDDGRFDDAVWFTGFVSAGGHLGWWDLYDGAGELQGVVEWIADGEGTAEFGIAAVDGEHAGDFLAWWRQDGDNAVTYHDASSEEDAWVVVYEEGDGELRHPGYNLGERSCWDVAYLDAECPVDDAE